MSLSGHNQLQSTTDFTPRVTPHARGHQAQTSRSHLWTGPGGPSWPPPKVAPAAGWRPRRREGAPCQAALEGDMCSAKQRSVADRTVRRWCVGATMPAEAVPGGGAPGGGRGAVAVLPGAWLRLQVCPFSSVSNTAVYATVSNASIYLSIYLCLQCNVLDSFVSSWLLRILVLYATRSVSRICQGSVLAAPASALCGWKLSFPVERCDILSLSLSLSAIMVSHQRAIPT